MMKKFPLDERQWRKNEVETKLVFGRRLLSEYRYYDTVEVIS